MNWIDYRELRSMAGTFSSLFVDFVSDFSRVQKFYSSNFRDEAHWHSRLEKVTGRQIDRSVLVQVLAKQNKDFHCGVRTLANIDTLLNDNAVAVVTGQQVGLFTGPLYTIYKTLTTLKLVAQLTERFPDYSFVPVFWLEGEDHDYEEVNSIKLVNAQNEVVSFAYEFHGLSCDTNFGAVGKLEFDEKIDELFLAIDQSLVQTEFKPKVLELFRTAYQKGMSFNRAFALLLNVLLENSGLVFLDPNDREVKQLLAPLFQRELRETPRFCQLVIDRSAELELQYHAQVKPKPLNLFFFHHGGRYLLEPRADSYSLKGTRQHLSKESIADASVNSPHLFSPNVVLRPLCQDWLLPTIAYVAGPAEIAYFAQLKPLYDEMKIPMPIIYPRASATIVEEKVEKVLDRFSLSVIDLFQDVEILKGRTAKQLASIDLDSLFGEISAALEGLVDHMKEPLQAVDPTLLGALENTARKMVGNVDGLKEKALAAQKRQHEAALRQLDKAMNLVFPQSNFQERELNVLYFLNKYGMEFLRWLYDELKIDAFKHQVITL
ncbi:MAG: bacillithiol biosynthesis cysteine-adding enzyme BshC [Ignavibacteria bacterium]|nr:bacillithiol biosynthesis cysteine-adding enzyme BshC [Ignavibacteria bacterium]